MTAMQALASVAKVSTRYGGRYVESIDGIEGSLSQQRDWFYFVNGYEADRSAAEYRLHPATSSGGTTAPGSGEPCDPVVGAFPEPFVTATTGKRGRWSEYDVAGAEAAARVLAGRPRVNVCRATTSRRTQRLRRQRGRGTLLSRSRRACAGGARDARRRGSTRCSRAQARFRFRSRPVSPVPPPSCSPARVGRAARAPHASPWP
jgi:hypothetical protein